MSGREARGQEGTDRGLPTRSCAALICPGRFLTRATGSSASRARGLLPKLFDRRLEVVEQASRLRISSLRGVVVILKAGSHRSKNH